MEELEENKIYFYFNKKKLIENFNNFSELGNIYYPLKTNSNEILLKTLQKNLINKENNGFLISSISNFETLQKVKVDLSKMCFINVLAEDETVRYLYNAGVRFFTFDNFNSLVNFAEYADLTKVRIAIRLSTIQVFSNRFTHLGANLEECIEMLVFLRDRCNDYGMSFYMQNDLKTEENVLEKMLQYIQEKFNNLGISFVSIGGLEQSKEINKKILEKFKTQFKINQIILEIGRYLVENTVEMETRIIREKIVNRRKTVIIKNGIYSGFFDILLYNKKFPIYLKTKEEEEIKLEYEKSKSNDYEFFLCGGSSDSGDKIGVMYINSKYKDELTKGAKLRVKNVGAYFEEFFMPYSKDLKKVFIEE